MAILPGSTKDDGTSAADERTPLLTSPENGSPSTRHDEQILPSDVNGDLKHSGNLNTAGNLDDKPMPYVQILLLCYATLCEPVAYFSIFPFINEMIERTGGIDKKNVGFYSGLIESLFSLVQMVLMIFYGQAADRFGRKPVLIFSLAGVSVATALFGMSTTLWQMIAFRCLAGVFAGSVVTVRVMLSENTTKITQARAFSWYMFTKNCGIFIGPLIGGGLANPATEYPGIFTAQFFKDYPYALSTFTASAVCLTATLSSLFFLKETRIRKSSGGASSEPEMSTWKVLKAPGVAIVLYIFGHTMTIALAYTAVSPAMQYTPVNLGGLGFSAKYIACTIALGGVSQAAWMLAAFPLMQKRLGTGGVLYLCAIAWPIFMAAFPVLNECLRHGWIVAFWVIGVPSIIIGSGVSMAFACVQLCINDISPSPEVLATVNSLALTVNSAMRAVTPVAATSLFAVGVKLQWADGHLVWFFIIALAAGLNIAFPFLPERARDSPASRARANDE
ncbi:Hypothetical protein R9X50_00158200 [Acrodontium crateriforme]|uniref:Major facilitator superfamily (MFS) profile domain-containing protein n=1 Tax=Acrodontium crateriforme TaxID=150365 RepID=A0AAQ3M5F8_9PEZI|nr:Hypothetical protein R9X50_00158200 [Acrodontium crateriforme]